MSPCQEMSAEPLASKYAGGDSRSDEELAWLERRVGRVHLQQRLGIERDWEGHVFGQGLNFFHIENWYSAHSVIANALRITGLYGRGRRNALDVRLNENQLELKDLPDAFDGFRILHISDLHLDMDPDLVHALIAAVRVVEYDICVLTGDYRARTFGSDTAAMETLAGVRIHLNTQVYGVLGNHDTIKMVRMLEDMDVSVLMNEAVAIERNGARICLAGIDDAHYFRVDNIEKAAEAVPPGVVSILLSHTPETYRQAAHADFNVMLCGHTHGGQICLPGGRPVIYDARCPRSLASGPWRYHDLIGYTSRGCGCSIVPVRLNCPPEITIHHLRRR